MQFVKERLGRWITAAIILVVGILCIVAGAALGNSDISGAQDSLNAISLTLGIILIVVGSLSLCLAILVAVIAKKGFAAVAIPGAVLLAFGISLVVLKYAYTFIDLLLKVVPYLLIVVGAVVLADAIFNLIRGILTKNVKGVLVGVIIEVIVAAAAIVLGALCIGSEPVIKYGTQLIVFGIIVCLFAVVQILLTFVKLPDAVVVVSAKEDKE